MSIINLMIDSETYKCDFRFERRLTIIRGDSGVGKSTLADLLEQGPQPDVRIESTYPVAVVNYGTWETILKADEDEIIIFDDLEVVASQKFASLCKQYVTKNNLYLIVIARECVGRKEFGMLSYSMNSIFNMVSDGVEHYLVPAFNYGKVTKKTLPNLCLTEDETAGFDFFKRALAIPVLHANGKSTIVDELKSLNQKSDINDKRVLVIVDTAAFGCHIEKLTNIARSLEFKLCIMTDYESFEEFLLQTNMLNKHPKVQQEFQNLSEHANHYLSWETYFKQLIADVTAKQPYKHNHSSKIVQHCYVESCLKCNPYIAKKCDKYIEEDKIIWLLKDTKYKRLLLLCQ